MNYLDKAIELLPARCREQAAKMSKFGIEEFRMRRGRFPTALYNGSEHEIIQDSITGQDLVCTVERATGASIYASAGELSEGYINYGGLRVGICGEAAINRGTVCSFRSYSSVSVRIPSEYHGICDQIVDSVSKPVFRSTIIISPPGGGKTTALREIVRKVSDAGYRISVVDERAEIAAVSIGQPQFDVGRCTDVLTFVPKNVGAMMMLRGMNPDIIAMDEITRPEDAETVLGINGCGVKLLATAHSADISELMRRPLYRELIEAGVFEYVVTINGCGRQRKYSAERIPQ